MAYRFWNQITNVKYLKNGNIRSCTPSKDTTQNYSHIAKQSHNAIVPSNLGGTTRALSETKKSRLGRFVTKAPPTFKNNTLQLRSDVIHRIQVGTKMVAHEARQRSQIKLPPYQLNAGADPRKYDKKIEEIKRATERMNRVERYQPRSMQPFCAKDTPSLEREQQRPFKFSVRKVDWEQVQMDEDHIQPIDNASMSSSESSAMPQNEGNNVAVCDNTPGNHPLQRKPLHFGNTQHKQGVRHFSSKVCKDNKETKKEGEMTNVHKHAPDEYWTKCECCPEMLPCDETVYYHEYRFPCPRDPKSTQCPIDCIPPCEDPPPPKVPLRRPPKCLRPQKVPECKPGCKGPPKCECCITPKCLPPAPCSPCPCIEPFVPQKLPTLKLCKKRTYQCQPCPKPPCKKSCADCFVPPKYLPPIIPGDCVCIEPTIKDVPPLPRLCMDPVQKVPECKPDCDPKRPSKLLKFVEKKTLPPIKSDCHCVEPPPLKPVKLVRLPKVCVCPPPPDPKCPPPPCPLKADDVCRWQYPTKKLKNYWCPDCRIPKKKYRWCKIHTRGQKIHKRKMSTKVHHDPRLLVINADTVQVRHFSIPPLKNSGIAAQAIPRLEASNNNALHRTVNGYISVRGMRHADKFKLLRNRGKCKPIRCPSFKDPCCPLRARDNCELTLKPLCCVPRKSPYPSFSECSEFHQLLTCECRETLPYLQPATETPNARKNILPPVVPRHKVVDPIFEEQCILHDLCRPFGHTYTCDTFNKGEIAPLRQRECLSPHRIPCCEHDQICDFKRPTTTKTCAGAIKERQFYRCECNCHKEPQGICNEAQQRRAKAILSKIRKEAKPCLGECAKGKPRPYSTMAHATRAFSTFTPPKLTRGMACGCGRRATTIDRRQEGCNGRAKQKAKPNFHIGALPEPLRMMAVKKAASTTNAPLMDSLNKLKKKAIACERGHSGRRMLLLKQAECAAKAVGMRLVPDHEKSCKHAEPSKCKAPVGGEQNCPQPEPKYPKNVCPECIPRHEVHECAKVQHASVKCEMPHKLSGPECRARLPSSCKMPLPPCNQHCVAQRCTCIKDHVPCCVTEAPYPAFSDCHPPFKRIVPCEHVRRDENSERSSRIINEMLKLSTSRRCYSTFGVMVQPSLVETVLACLGDKKEQKAHLHQAANCTCARCSSLRKGIVQKHTKPNLRRNLDSRLPDAKSRYEISNFPEEIFKEVDKDNLISLAPKTPTPMEKLKKFIYNYAMKIEQVAPKRTIDGFKKFENTNETKEKKTSDSSKKVTPDKTEENNKLKFDEVKAASIGPEAIILRGTNDLLYLIDGANKVVNLRPQILLAHKTKVMSGPVCTHILLDCGEMMLEFDFNLMNTIVPMRNRKYLPFGLSHEEYEKNERKVVENLHTAIENSLNPKA